MKHVTIPDTWTPDQALAVATFLERVAEAIWRAHGHPMALRYVNIRPYPTTDRRGTVTIYDPLACLDHDERDPRDTDNDDNLF